MAVFSRKTTRIEGSKRVTINYALRALRAYIITRPDGDPTRQVNLYLLGLARARELAKLGATVVLDPTGARLE